MQAPDAISGVDTLAQRLKLARDAAGLTQGALAKRVRMSPGTIGNLETGLRKTARNLTGIAAALGVRPEWLADGKGPMKADTSAAAQAQPWPFESISPADWGRLTERQKGVAEDAARQTIERLGASGKRTAAG